MRIAGYASAAKRCGAFYRRPYERLLKRAKSAVPGALSHTGTLRLGGASQLRCELEQKPERQADHVREVPVDALDESGAEPLYGVAAGPVLPLTPGEVEPARLRGQLAGVDGRPGGALPLPARLGAGDAESAEDLMGAAGQQREVRARLLGIVGLADDPPVDADIRVAADDQGVGGRECAGLQPGVLEHELLRVAGGQLLDVGRRHLEGDAEAPQELAPLRRP